jgi:hypothetical protein
VFPRIRYCMHCILRKCNVLSTVTLLEESKTVRRVRIPLFPLNEISIFVVAEISTPNARCTSLGCIKDFMFAFEALRHCLLLSTAAAAGPLHGHPHVLLDQDHDARAATCVLVGLVCRCSRTF